MKSPKLFTALVALAATSAVGLASCDSFLDINQSPNAVLEAPASNVLVAAQTGLGFTMGSDLHRFTSLIVQQFSGQGGAQTAEFDRYNITPTDINNVWRGGIFAGALADMQKLIDQTQATSPAYSGIAKIMKAYQYQVTVDAFGDVPYTEALKFDGNLAPKFDASADVYKALFLLLDEGVADMKKESLLRPGSDDLIYGTGTAAERVERWERLANTIKLRMYIHYFPKLSTTANADMAKLIGENRFLRSNADNFKLDFDATPNRNNPIDQFEKARNNTFFPSATLVTLMDAKSDPRRPFYLTNFPVGTNRYVGAQNGTGLTGAPNADFSRINTYLRGNATPGTGFNNFDGTAPIRMLTFAEYNLILAEYYARTGNLPLAQTSFVAGIRASMEDAKVPAAEITAYIAARPVLTAANAIRSIIEEKFIANYGVAVEPWTDYRRTGFPTLLLPATVAPGQKILRILPYSDLERTSNPNTPARADLTTPAVFWDPGA